MTYYGSGLYGKVAGLSHKLGKIHFRVKTDTLLLYRLLPAWYPPPDALFRLLEILSTMFIPFRGLVIQTLTNALFAA